MADLAPGWTSVPLQDLGERTFGGGTPSTKNASYWDGDIPWITTAIIGEDDLFLTRYQRRITNEGLSNSSSKIAPSGSLLIGTRVGVGKAVIASFDVAVNQDITVVVPSEGTSAEFLAFALKSPSIQRIFSNRKRGTTIKGIPRKDVLRIGIPLPPLPEQRAIARVLRTVQEAKERTEAVIAAAKEVKKSLMKHLFTYGPVPVDQADQVKLKETPYGQLPADWEVVPLEEVAEVQTGAAKGRKIGKEESIKVPYLRVANVQDGYLDLREMKMLRIRKSELERFSLREGDVVLTEGGDFDKLGRGYIWRGEIPNCIHQNHVFAVRSNPETVLSHFLATLAHSSYGKAYFLSVAHRTTNLACINATKLRGLPTPVPTLQEQQGIASSIAVVERRIEAEQGYLGALDRIFKTLLHDLMTAKIRVHDLIEEGEWTP